MKLGLGTVQFGLHYGVSNEVGQPSPDKVKTILNWAADSGVQVLDTAFEYGTSEEVLGNSLPSNHRFRIVTKTSLQNSEIENHFQKSLSRLKTDSVYALLFHRIDQLHFLPVLKKLKELKLTQKIGVSIYQPSDVDQILDSSGIDIVQLPINLLDQRLIQNGALSKLKKRGIEIHARSVFLQGLLLMNPDTIPSALVKARGLVSRMCESVARQKLSMLEATLGFVLSIPEVDHVIVGANTLQEFQQIVEAAKSNRASAWIQNESACFATMDETIINPSLWRKHA